MARLVEVQIEGLDRLMDRSRNTGALIGKPLKRFFTRAAISVQNHARRAAPVDTGRLRSSIAYDVDGRALPTWADIGPSVEYGASVEFGIGVYNVGPGGLGQRPLPTAAQLEGWARRHGANPYLVARAIEKRGGVEPQPYMEPGFRAAERDIDTALNDCAREIGEQWSG